MDAIVEKLRRENQELREEIRRLEGYRTMAYRDDLTGLYNRRFFDERLREELARARRWTWPCSLIAIDIDEFKEINDSFGHTTGDEVLAWVARFLAKHMREIDVACRTGGDEFSIILPYTDVSGVTTVVNRLRQNVQSSKVRQGLRVSLSIGSATYPIDANTASELITGADDSMYLEKRRRKATRAAGRTPIKPTSISDLPVAGGE